MEQVAETTLGHDPEALYGKSFMTDSIQKAYMIF
jgi:hypothetical protein